jgi:hypothetical protein
MTAEAAEAAGKYAGITLGRGTTPPRRLDQDMETVSDRSGNSAAAGDRNGYEDQARGVPRRDHGGSPGYRAG